MSSYNVIAATDEYTVVAEYTPEIRKAESYQSEASLEKEFIRLLSEQGYEYLNIHDESALVSNLRRQMELLNNIQFSDNEWKMFFEKNIASANDGIIEKTRRIQTDHIQILQRDDGSTKNIYLLDKKHIHNNKLQVINQYVNDEGAQKNRYDVTILVNGLPMVHIELKRRGVQLREAFNQIKRYQRDSFWSGNRLFEYVQLFVISNGTNTKYYSNTTRESHVKELMPGGRARSKKTSNSFEYTSFWADGKNVIIPDLIDFTKTFFSKHTILNILTKYCIFTVDDMLLVMRPYQIVATERIINRIETSNNYKKMGSRDAGGYIWHTTGSGKTLTSFKTSQLVSNLPYVKKVLFVVDRRDLDYQTMKEYDKFEKGAANGNASTKILEKQLSDPNVKIIITTIQKLEKFIRRNASHEVYDQQVVLIFDECHRSQFGEMHTRICKFFNNYHIFGFTGTPIFAANAGSSKYPTLRTTQDAFGDMLHSYTIVNAINDKNVLPFNVDYVSTVKAADDMQDSEVSAINTERIMGSPERISKVTSYILEHFDQKTRRNEMYDLRGQRLYGFNSILAVSSIPLAMKYYREFERQMKESGKALNVSIIYSYAPNDDLGDLIFEGEMTIDGLDADAHSFLEYAIGKYNSTFNSNFGISGGGFDNYYKDVSSRVKNRQVDLLIVVNMFLTGFDATTLNTLWVDKNLRNHGLIQAFSRTNRILNTVKTYGNIICFRNLRKATDDALALFGDENAGGTVLLKTFDDYYKGYEKDGKHTKGYLDLVNDLLGKFPLNERIIGETREKEFISLFGSILRLKNILSSFDQFMGNEILTERDFQDFQSIYLDLHGDYSRKGKKWKEDVTSDVVFEMELIRQVEVNIDYILNLVKKYGASNCKNKEILVDINKAVGSSIQLRSKRKLIEDFIKRVDPSTDVDSAWLKFVEEQKEVELEALIEEYGLNSNETRKLIRNSFRDGLLRTTGTSLDRVMPPTSRFGGSRDESKSKILESLMEFFEKYFGI